MRDFSDSPFSHAYLKSLALDITQTPSLHPQDYTKLIVQANSGTPLSPLAGMGPVEWRVGSPAREMTASTCHQQRGARQGLVGRYRPGPIGTVSRSPMVKCQGSNYQHLPLLLGTSSSYSLCCQPEAKPFKAGAISKCHLLKVLRAVLKMSKWQSLATIMYLLSMM